MYTLARVRSAITGWSLAPFKEEALGIYQAVSGALADGDQTTLRKLVTAKELTQMKREIKRREQGGWTRIDWALEEVKAISVVRGRMMAPNPEDTSFQFAQLTVEFETSQRFAAYGKDRKLVAGDPEARVDVVERWVLEHGLTLPHARWRLAGRLAVEAPPPPSS